ncbi:DUF4402 domain-containing protein [Pseudoalteromonas sp. J010]|uniref:DUF4402 domain-containing protein n=1 Tax=Pseudoalteromonas sp. J010 TaxID=998465 RepID=UPI000F64C5D2|nr:DUF4402 domain-containing protein [Pseudoalteromonas sp. J010]RRS06689.1 DUF4402 domain-containing protein [Pseudoalteromonas sp. J010]
MINKIKVGLITLSLLSVTSVAVASQNKTFNASVTVQNAFTLEKVNDLKFGTIRAMAESTKQATLTRPADSTEALAATSQDGAQIGILTDDSSPAQFTISGVTRYANMKISLPALTVDHDGDAATPEVAAIELVSAEGPSDTAKFELLSLSLYAVEGQTPNAAIEKNGDGEFVIAANNEGKATFNVGASIGTDKEGGSYLDDTYSGTVAITVSY